MKWDEQAERLRRKAAGDEEAMSALLAVSSVPDEVIGFHAQQAVEKLLKALLSHRRVAFRRTHDLTELLDLLASNGVTIPPQIAEVRQLGHTRPSSDTRIFPATRWNRSTAVGPRMRGTDPAVGRVVVVLTSCRQSSKPPVAGGVAPQRGVELGLVEIGPADLRHPNLRVADLPEQIVADAHLARRADQQIGLGACRPCRAGRKSSLRRWPPDRACRSRTSSAMRRTASTSSARPP